MGPIQVPVWTCTPLDYTPALSGLKHYRMIRKLLTLQSMGPPEVPGPAQRYGLPKLLRNSVRKTHLA